MNHAERLEADARYRSLQQHKQRNNWSELSLSLTKVRAQSRRETDALKDEVESLKSNLQNRSGEHRNLAEPRRNFARKWRN